MMTVGFVVRERGWSELSGWREVKTRESLIWATYWFRFSQLRRLDIEDEPPKGEMNRTRPASKAAW